MKHVTRSTNQSGSCLLPTSALPPTSGRLGRNASSRLYLSTQGPSRPNEHTTSSWLSELVARGVPRAGNASIRSIYQAAGFCYFPVIVLLHFPELCQPDKLLRLLNLNYPSQQTSKSIADTWHVHVLQNEPPWSHPSGLVG